MGHLLPVLTLAGDVLDVDHPGPADVRSATHTLHSPDIRPFSDALCQTVIGWVISSQCTNDKRLELDVLVELTKQSSQRGILFFFVLPGYFEGVSSILEGTADVDDDGFSSVRVDDDEVGLEVRLHTRDAAIFRDH